jgi:Ca2+-binding RTX toxin-like protein
VEKERIMAVKLNKHDLEFILAQIKIAEAHSAGTPLDELVTRPHLPYGLRTVDGSYNNVLPGREFWGAADQTMPRMFDPHWRNDADGDQMYFGPPSMGAPPPVTNTDYDSAASVADADPRIISNLIVDQTPGNPAAITAALQNAGYEGNMAAAVLDIQTEYQQLKALTAALEGVNDALLETFRAEFQALTDSYGIELDGDSLVIPNVAPDEGLSAPFNGWMTFFGQFFDHGLDLISKGGAGTIYVPLQPDDPLYVPGGHTNFMVLTRATQFDGPGADGVLGTADDTERESINVTTPFVDQNQTYTSHPSHQIFLREYAMVDGKPLATGRMLDGQNGGLPTWADVKLQAKELLGIELTDKDVFNIPLIRTDLYGEFIRNADGFPQVITNIGPDGIPNTEDDLTASGTPADPLTLRRFGEPEAAGDVVPVRTSHSFLDDIAHNAVPVITSDGILIVDNVIVDGVDPAGNAVQFNPLTGANTEYDNELLDRHFITGDGRGNENIGLTAVHHVFHSEHNRQVETNKLEILKSGDLAFVNEWLLVDITQTELDAAAGLSGAALRTYADTLGWDGERLFQTARFATEMQYQHLVFEEFGRKVQPMIDPFVFNTITDIDPAIFAEFAHVVYRFGHSMLTEDLGRMFLDENGNPVIYNEAGEAVPVDPVDLETWGNDIGLIEAFLNPLEFDKDGTISHDQAAGAIFRGMTRVHGNEIDEFVTDALRNNLLGLPLDLAAINIARGRDTGMPTLNEARQQLYAASSSTFLKPYESWADFASNLKTPASVINFIAAYGTHASIVAAGNDLSERRDAATLLVLGDPTLAGAAADAFNAERMAFLNGPAATTGVNEIDLWIGGLAEKKMPFGGFLGSTFNAVFEAQMELLQDLDRFYYLTRTQGLNLLNELENNAFAKLIMANTDMVDPGPDGLSGTDDDGPLNYHVGVDSFALHDFVLHVDPTKQIGPDPTHDDATLNGLGQTKVQRDNPATAGVDPNYIRVLGGEHTAINGTDGDDTIISDFGDDAIWGGGGNDRIESGAGVDFVIGGAGDDIITDSGDTGDFIKGEDGDDVIANSNGLDVIMGGDGQDVVIVGVDGTEVFAGEGNDFILGGADIDFLMGNEGDDWIEGGDGFDTIAGENSELFFNSTIIGHDVAFAGENENDFDMESGDDIMVQGESVMRNEGMLGFDWAIHKDNRVAADSDMRIPIFTTVADNILRDRFDQTEALSGWIHNDVLRGDDRGSREEIEVELDMTGHELTHGGVGRINGLSALLGSSIVTTVPAGVDPETVVAWTGGNILIGGDGNDTFEGRGGNDFIHGDAWLNVRISVRELDGDGNVTTTEAFTVGSLKQVVEIDGVSKPLSEFLLSGDIKPKQLTIVREILYDENANGDVDTAIFAGNMSWYEITHVGDRTYVARREQEEIDPQVDEGTDTLIGIERIQFADQIYTIRETGNVDPTGRLMISGLPAAEDEPLTVSSANVRDLNNPDGLVTDITYRWQIERNDGTGDYIDIPGARGDTFTPSDEHTGLRIRVLGTYVDGGGVTETVTSAPTDVVIGINDQPVGDLLISDMSPTEDRPLTATAAFTDADGMSDAFEEALLTYQWQYSATGAVAGDSDAGWINVPAAEGGNDRSFTPGPAQVGQYLRVVVVYQDDLLNTHRVNSAVTEIVGNHLISDAAIINGSGDGTTAGADWIQGGDGNNNIAGLAGGDLINGGGGSDTIAGGDGDDTLAGGQGDDVISGDAGNDTILYGAGDDNDLIDGGTGFDTLKVTQATSNSNDNVTVSLSGGSLTNVGGMSVQNVENAELDLGAGTDTLNYNGTSDAVEVDLLTGTATGFSFVRGVENVTGGTGNDTLLGNVADNHLVGAAGNDTLRGGFGNDNLEGNAGADLLYGEQGDDIINGGDGDDRVDGGVGNDTASYAGAAAPVTVTLDAIDPQNTVGAGTDWLVGIENLIGSSHADTLTGNASDNLIDGGAGADTMTGGLGNDIYVVDHASDNVVEAAGGGNDTVRSSLAAYTLHANVENLVVVSGGDATGNDLDNRLTGDAEDNILDGGLGIDTVVLDGAITDYEFALVGGNLTVTSASGGTDTLLNIERAEIGGISYAILRGTNGVDALAGTADAELILGFNGVDSLQGGGGDDILVGGNQADAMAGGTGSDTYIVNNGGDTVDETGGDGEDVIYSSVTRNLNAVAQVIGDVENLTLTGTANINAVGNGLDNGLTGNSGNNTLNGGGGADELVGAAGEDALNGGAGNDSLAGGDGNDTLNGAGGTADVAVFDGAAGEYIFNASAGSLASVTDIVGAGGTDTLANIERVRFGDGVSLAIMTDAPGQDSLMQATEASIILGGDGSDEIRGSDADDVIIGGAGDDFLNGSDVPDGDNAVTGATDDDIFIWNVGDGSDTINGGFEGADGDRLVINGNAEAEVYRIYTIEEAIARIAFEDGDVGGDFEAEIVVTRQVAGGEEVVISAMTEIEEITINGTNVAGNGTAGNDTFEIYGNFDTTTSLRPNTITLTGSAGDDTVDISSLRSAHRIIFHTRGGQDVIIGTLRPGDVIQLPDGALLEDYETSIGENGVVTMSNGTHSVSFISEGGLPDVVSPGDDDDDDDDDDQGTPGDGDDDDDDHDDDDHDACHDHDDDDQGAPAPAPSGRSTSGNDHLVGTADDDNLTGGSGDDRLEGRGGDDTLSGGSGDDELKGGNGDDMLSGGSGDDLLKGGEGDDALGGGSGDDRLDGGDGDDVLTGGGGDDVFVFSDGDDRVTDFDVDDDVIDLSALGITAANFASRVAMAQSGDGAVLRIDGHSMLFDAMTAGDLAGASFRFAGGGVGAAPLAAPPEAGTQSSADLDPTPQALDRWLDLARDRWIDRADMIRNDWDYV